MKRAFGIRKGKKCFASYKPQGFGFIATQLLLHICEANASSFPAERSAKTLIILSSVHNTTLQIVKFAESIYIRLRL